ncbi:hypothetical protein DERP_009308 [Dermatophagoides pteronyssinus]|uniref:Uncharacterized protein n=1 Tax=Dermatophagoides pteronyssinus TaxID=6956 RepID=A0ABQ8ITS3_DERPT|nr:hypothetical protein DERP_009308 [Dermatophagoides pteronyssinus]
MAKLVFFNLPRCGLNDNCAPASHPAWLIIILKKRSIFFTQIIRKKNTNPITNEPCTMVPLLSESKSKSALA